MFSLSLELDLLKILVKEFLLVSVVLSLIVVVSCCLLGERLLVLVLLRMD